MAWEGIIGHDRIVERFRRAMTRGRLASSYLFVGPPGVGKRALALKLAQALLCRGRAANVLDPCGTCASCRQAMALTHPDLLLLAKPADKSELPLSMFIGDRDHRMQTGLCHDIALRPYLGDRRVAVVDDADLLGEEAANCLLKTLEEPPPGSVLILIGTSAERQLPTIRSRCQLIRFEAPQPEQAAELVAAALGVADRQEALRLARYGEGSLERAAELASPDLWAFRERLLRGLSELPAGPARLAVEVTGFVEKGGKEAVERRLRLRQVIEFAIGFYRCLLRRLCDRNLQPDPNVDEELGQAVGRALAAETGFDDLLAAACLERCLEALAHLERNAHVATLAECWLDDLARLSAGEILGSVASL